MKKSVFFTFFSVFLFFPCFAGSFYSNIVVLPADAQNFHEILTQMDINAYYVLKDSVAVIYEENIDYQDIKHGMKLTKDISKIFNSIAVYTTVHDSDILLMYIYKNDNLIFLYDSMPGYFNGEDIPPRIIFLDKLIEVFPFVSKDEMLNILKTSVDDLYAEELHERIINLLKLPLFSVGFGYNSLNDIDERRYFEDDFQIKINKIGGNNRQSQNLWNAIKQNEWYRIIITCVFLIFIIIKITKNILIKRRKKRIMKYYG
jgi:hypothetical protein